MYHPASFVQLHGGYRSKAEEFKRVDHFGLFFLISGLTLFLLGVSWGGNPQPWTSDKILGLNIVSMAAGAMYIALSVIWPQRKSQLSLLNLISIAPLLLTNPH